MFFNTLKRHSIYLYIVTIIIMFNIYFTHRFTTYLKIFMMMEMIWGMELILWFAHINVPVVLIPVNIINNLQGIIIFIIFVCRKKIKNLLLKRFRHNWDLSCKILMNNTIAWQISHWDQDRYIYKKSVLLLINS